jgi:hypothetical protein
MDNVHEPLPAFSHRTLAYGADMLTGRSPHLTGGLLGIPWAFLSLIGTGSALHWLGIQNGVMEEGARWVHELLLMSPVELTLGSLRMMQCC